MEERARVAARQRVATNARVIRLALGWTQEEAAEAVGCSVQALQRVERASANPTLDFLSQLAAAYNIDLHHLFEPTGPWRPPRAGRPSAAAQRRRPPREGATNFVNHPRSERRR